MPSQSLVYRQLQRCLHVVLAGAILSVGASIVHAQTARRRPIPTTTTTTRPIPRATTRPTPRTVPKQRVLLHVPAMSSRIGGTAHVVAFATNALGARLSGLRLGFRWGTGGCNATTNANGRASCHTASGKIDRSLKVTFAGDERYDAAEASADLKVHGYSGQLTAAGAPTILLPETRGRTNRSVYLRARVLDTATRRPLSGQKIEFFAGGQSLGVATSNRDGFAARTVPGKNIALSRFMKSGDIWSGMLEASTVDGAPALAIEQLALFFKNNYHCPSPPKTLTDRPSWLPIETRKCSVRKNAFHQAGARGSATLLVKRQYQQVSVLSKSPSIARVKSPELPAPNCSSSACKPRCQRVGYKSLNAGLLHKQTIAPMEYTGCRPSKVYDLTVKTDGLESVPFKFRALDRCSITAPSGSSNTTAWNHNAQTTLPIAVVPTFQYSDPHFKPGTSVFYDPSQYVVDEFFIVHVPVELRCR